MAVKYAVANGNWNAGATWNGGSVPTIDDDVELNGHTITVTTNIVAKTVKNENGGYITCNATTLSVSIGTVIQMSATTSIIRFELSGNPSNFVFSCNIEQQVNKPVISVVARAGVNHSVLINGNITLQPYNYLYELTASNIFFYLAINGNVTSVSDYAYLQGLAYNTRIPKLTINGLCQNVSPRVNVDTFDMNGRLEVAVGEIVCTNFNINGSIAYKSTNNTIGVRYTTLNILNPETFTWKDVTEPRSNPFIIVTNADMNNHQQYPPENEVKQGTEYVWGEKVGTYTPDYPPESVVLKDYEYGDSDDRKTGTMENEVIVEVDNTNTINVYPYKRRNNG